MCKSGWSSSLHEISDSEEQDPSLLLPPVDSHARDIRIGQGPYQPKLSKYKVTVYRRKSRSFAQNGMIFMFGWSIHQKLTKCIVLLVVYLHKSFWLDE